MIKVYVAGKYDDNNIISALENMRLGMRVATKLLLMGYAPFVPWFDYHFVLMLQDGERITKSEYHKYSLQWLEVSDCILALPNWKEANGAIDELKRAKEINIPTYYSIDDLIKNENNTKSM